MLQRVLCSIRNPSCCRAVKAEIKEFSVSSGSIRIGIIGGGAAGLFAACQIKSLSAGRDIRVSLIEKNSIPGKKLTVTGHGRCNITNRKDVSLLKEGYHEAVNFIYPALKEFGPEDTICFMENELGLKLKEEDNNRMFPVCDSAVVVRDTILDYLKGSTEIICDAKVMEVKKDGVFKVKTSKGSFDFDAIVLSCGGSSFPKTGSTGDSYKIAGMFGHTIVPLRGALAPVRLEDGSLGFASSLSGVSVTAKVSLLCGEKVTASRTGEVLFADFGLTGPAVMAISREVPADISGMNVSIEMDIIPSLSDEEFDRELQKLIGEHADTKMATLLSRFAPASVAAEICSKAGISGLYAQGFTKENRKKLIREAKHLRLGLKDVPQIEKAYVTRGGVSLKEVDRKTMQSKKVEGLYIIGEALDIDGISGGYNLQACMSEAYLAARSILEI